MEQDEDEASHKSHMAAEEEEEGREEEDEGIRDGCPEEQEIRSSLS